MPTLNRNEKIKCGDCGNLDIRQNAARHRKRCAKGVVSCPDCKYSTYNQQEMNYHMAKMHAPSRSKQSTVCSSCEQEFSSYYSLQQHRRKEHGAKQRKPSDTLADLNEIVEEEGEDGEKLKEELSACQHFLVNTEMENGRPKVFYFQMSKLDTKIINEKLEEVFNKLDSAAKINIALDFVIPNIETGEYRYFYAHENNTLFEKSHLLCTKADLITIQRKVEKFDIVEQCTQERQKRKWRLKLITNVPIFAALLKKIPMGCPDSVLPEPLLRHTQVNCLLSNKYKEPYKDHLCLFHALAMYINGHNDLDSHTSRYFTDFISKSGYDPKSFRGVSVEDLPVVEEIVQRNFIYDFDIQEGEYLGELARRSIGRFDKTVKLLRFNNHIIHTIDINSFFKCFRCSSCDTFFNKSDNFNKHLLRCKDRVKHIYPKNVYELRETLFEKLEGFSLPVSEGNKLFNSLAIFDFESICVPTEELKETQTTFWIGKHVLISLSILLNLIDEPILLYNKDPQNLINDFVSNFELLAEQSKLEMRKKFQKIEVAVNERMKKIFDQLNEHGKNFCSNKFEYEDECIEDSEEADTSTQFLRIQKNQLIDLKQHLGRYVNTLPVFGFNSGRYILNLITPT